MTFDEDIAGQLVAMTADPRFATRDGLAAVLRFLAKWRSKLIDNTVVARDGVVVQAGPFAGMTFVAASSEANVSPRLLGSYEAELHPLIEEIAGSGVERVIDIGCADGYYAVGLARRLPQARILAFDINPVAQRQCAELAAANAVADRVTVGGEFRAEHFADHAGARTLVFLDAEGAEDDLLRPDLYPALRRLSVLVECHDVFRPGLSGVIAARFAESHAIRRIEPQLPVVQLPPWFGQLSHLDQLLAVWEWRMGPTPWLYMTPHP